MSKTSQSTTTTTTKPEIEDRIRTLAYQMWEDEGRPDGRAEAHWEKACLVVMDADAGTNIQSPEWLNRQVLKAEKPHPALPTSTQEHLEELKRRTVSRSAA
jgi:Protein of unknown function (DUF2934)